MIRTPRGRQLAQFVMALGLLTIARGQSADAQRLVRDAVALERGTVTPERMTVALAKLKHAVALDPGYIDAYIELALCHRTVGQLDDAINACTEAVKLKPDSARALA